MHQWQVDDILLWDNRCAMHHRTPIDVVHRRIMHCTQIKGEPVIAAWDEPAAVSSETA